MKISHQQFYRASGGSTLIECLVYVALFFVVGWLAFEAFYRTWGHTRSLRYNADDIAAALKTGEQWRTDVRAAVATPEAAKDGTSQIFRLRQQTNTVSYVFKTNTLYREVPGLPPTILLSNVKASAMEKEQRQHVTAWKWEVELKTRQKNARVRPLFTFTAVSGKKVRP